MPNLVFVSKRDLFPDSASSVPSVEEMSETKIDDIGAPVASAGNNKVGFAIGAMVAAAVLLELPKFLK